MDPVSFLGFHDALGTNEAADVRRQNTVCAALHGFPALSWSSRRAKADRPASRGSGPRSAERGLYAKARRMSAGGIGCRIAMLGIRRAAGTPGIVAAGLPD